MNKNIRYINAKAFNWHLMNVYNHGMDVIKAPRKNHESSTVANLEIGASKVKLTYRWLNKTTTYCFSLDGNNTDAILSPIPGHEAMRILSYYAKVPRLNTLIDSRVDLFQYTDEFNGKPTFAVQNSKAILWFDPNLNNSRIEGCYSYDLNSSYSYAMLQDMPDTTAMPDEFEAPKAGEIGFETNGDVYFGPSAHICRFVFKAIESPFKRFVNVWYEKKKTAVDIETRSKAKAVLNFCVGYFARINPFIRNTIVQRANYYILSFKDENTIYINTDSIITKAKRPDLDKLLSDEVGGFKLEHEGSFAYKDFNYQWNNDLPKYRGISRGWFRSFEKINGHKYDILRDEIPNNTYNEYIIEEIKDGCFQLKKSNPGKENIK